MRSKHFFGRDDVSLYVNGIKEVQLSDLVVATESIDLPSSQEAYEFKEFDLRD